MNHNPNFYSVIIGTELLNGRRKDAHFAFLNEQLLKRGWTHKASFVIEDDTNLMKNIFNLIKSDPNSVMFCYGGIGATPDDYTRQIAGEIFTESNMQFHSEAKDLIENQFGEEAYPHRINMAYLPKGAKLLKNVVNNVPGFYLDDRFFFTPGFPSMSQSMVIEALDKCYLKNKNEKYRKTLTIFTGENEIIDFMKNLPKEIEASSLPKLIDKKRRAVLSLASYDEKLLDSYFKKAQEYLDEKKIEYVLKDLFESNQA